LKKRLPQQRAIHLKKSFGMNQRKTLLSFVEEQKDATRETVEKKSNHPKREQSIIKNLFSKNRQCLYMLYSFKLIANKGIISFSSSMKSTSAFDELTVL
jgi:hypothetical protein